MKTHKLSNERCSRQDIPRRERFELERDYFLSAAPQAEPQAVGFFSGLSAAPQAAGFSSGLSAAPQAEPQAAGFFSGLSAAPQADVEASLSVFPHPDRSESAISISSFKIVGIAGALSAPRLHCMKRRELLQVLTFL